MTLRVLIIIPTYNERASLEQVLLGLKTSHPGADVLVIDDASPDGTGFLADQLARADAQVSVIHRPKKLGLGTAYIAGFEHALQHSYDVVVEFDGDGSHQPEELGRLLAAIDAGADLALGSRWIEGGKIVGWPRWRQWISRIGTRVARVCLGSKLHDLTSGFRAIRISALSTLPLDEITTQGYGFQVETAWMLERFGARIEEVAIVFIERQKGQSKMSFAIVREALAMVLRFGVMRVWAPSRLPQPRKRR